MPLFLAALGAFSGFKYACHLLVLCIYLAFLIVLDGNVIIVSNNSLSKLSHGITTHTRKGNLKNNLWLTICQSKKTKKVLFLRTCERWKKNVRVSSWSQSRRTVASFSSSVSGTFLHMQEAWRISTHFHLRSAQTASIAPSSLAITTIQLLCLDLCTPNL